jgi:hypothetical protein
MSAEGQTHMSGTRLTAEAGKTGPNSLLTVLLS